MNNNHHKHEAIRELLCALHCLYTQNDDDFKIAVEHVKRAERYSQMHLERIVESKEKKM